MHTHLKHSLIMRTIFIYFACIGFFGCAVNTNIAKQATCRVNDPDISKYYVGECVSGYAHGKGNASGRDSYIGEFKHGNKHGQGTYKWGLNSDWAGHVFVGESVNDELVKGTAKVRDGIVLEGTFINMKLNGVGTRKDPDGLFYEGVFKDDKLHGFGTIKNSTSILKQGLFSNGKLKISCKDPVSCQSEVEALEKLLVSGEPEEVYLAGVKFETESDFDQAKTYYNNVIVRFAKTPVALKAADRLLAINDKLDRQQRDSEAMDIIRLQQLLQGFEQRQLCEAQRKSCYASCKKNDFSCISNCSTIICY